MYAPCPRRWPPGGPGEGCAAVRPAAPSAHASKMADRASFWAPLLPTPGISCWFRFSVCLVGGFCWGFVLEVFFLLAAAARGPRPPRLSGPAARPLPQRPGCVGPAVGAGLRGEGGSCPLFPPLPFPPARPGRLLASSRTPDAPGQGSAWRVKLEVRPRLCRSVFAEPGGCVVRRTSPRNLNKGTKSCLPPPQNSTQTPGAAVASPPRTATKKKHRRLFKFMKCKTA